MKFKSDLDEDEYRALMRADRHLAAVHRAVHRACLRKAELSQLARQPRQVDVWRQVAAEIAGRVSRLDYTLNRRYPGTYEIVEDLGHAWISECLRDVGTARGLGLLAECLVGSTHALAAVAESVSAAHDALVALDDARRANERRRVSEGRFKSRAA